MPGTRRDDEFLLSRDVFTAREHNEVDADSAVGLPIARNDDVSLHADPDAGADLVAPQ